MRNLPSEEEENAMTLPDAYGETANSLTQTFSQPAESQG
jgi:hypothetical protein